jgi:glycosyltransferase involved in cell wall biosynthesis
MRILFWNGPFLPRIGGVEIFTARLAEGLMARGHQVAVVANGQAGIDPEIVPGLQVTRLPLLEEVNPTSPDPRVKLRMIAQVTADAAAVKRAFRPDLVHVNLTDAGPFFHLRTLQAHPAVTIVTFQAALERPVTPDSVTGALAHDRITARRMGMAGRQRALDRFTVTSTIDHYEALYRSLMLAEVAAG